MRANETEKTQKIRKRCYHPKSFNDIKIKEKLKIPNPNLIQGINNTNNKQ